MGGRGDDLIFALAGDDFIDAGADNDTVEAGDGRDFVIGGFGDDDLHGQGDSDVVWGGFAFGDLTIDDFDLTNPNNFDDPPLYAEMEALYPTGYRPPLITPKPVIGLAWKVTLNDGRDTLHGNEGIDFPLRR